MTTENTSEKKRYTHVAYFIKNKADTDKPEWVKVGVGWENADGEGMNLSLDVLGQQIPITVRKFKPKPE